MVVAAACCASVARLGEAVVPPSGPHHSSAGRHVASLLKQRQQRQKWDVKTATEEMHTEWGIVLRRYYMVDMEMADITLKLNAVSPPPGSPEPAEAPDAEVAAELKRKIAKLNSNLQAARRDLDSSENTVVNMEVDPHLDAPAKDALNKEHQQQQEQAEELSHLGEVACEAATASLSALQGLLDAAQQHPQQQHPEKQPASATGTPAKQTPAASVAPSAAGIVKLRATATASASNATLGAQAEDAGATRMRQASSAAARTFASAAGGFRKSAQAYQEQRARLEESARKVSARLLAMRQTVRRARP